MSGKVESEFVKYVNPQYLKFNRPFLIAGSVFAIVHSLVIVIAIVLSY
jgi:hypothetical protein